MEDFLLLYFTIVCLLFYLLSRIFHKTEYVDPQGRAVFISGCDTGLGNRLAIYFDDLGCIVYAGCLEPGTARGTLPESVIVVPLDVCDEESVNNAKDLVENSLKETGKELWAVINNAGVCVYGEFVWQTWDQCQRQVDVNLLGTMRVTKAFVPLVKRTKGRIITTTSINGSIAYPGLSVYSATKFALEGFSHAIRLELWRLHKIKVIIVEPGDLAKVTSIMARHERNAEEMWNSMSFEDQETYGDFFRMYHRVTMKNFGLTSPPCIEASPLLDDMKDAVLNKNPYRKYISACFLLRMFYRLLALMPLKLIDSFLNQVTSFLYRSDRRN